jgi:serine/threonine-protein phosphatase PGAM5
VGIHTLYLVRHGQYDELNDGGLTDLGWKQAAHVGKALKGHNISRIYTSTLRRALETTEVVSRSFPNVPIRKTTLLCEAVPTKIPWLPKYAPLSRIKADRARADAAFEKLFRPVRKTRSDLLIAHGNIIRYFVSKALGVPLITWLKLGSTHCSITEIVIEQSGRMYLRGFNETHHLPRAMRTVSLAAKKRD